jgi:integrase
MLALYTALRNRGNSDRTIYNKATSLGGWFKFMQLPVKEIIPQNPDYTEKEVEIYNRQELKMFFAACKTDYSRVVFKLLLQTGLRMREAMHLGWHNVDFHTKVIPRSREPCCRLHDQGPFGTVRAHPRRPTCRAQGMEEDQTESQIGGGNRA